MSPGDICPQVKQLGLTIIPRVTCTVPGTDIVEGGLGEVTVSSESEIIFKPVPSF